MEFKFEQANIDRFLELNWSNLRADEVPVLEIANSKKMI